MDNLERKIDLLTEQVAKLTEAQARRSEFIEEMNPVMKQVMAGATEQLESLEARGYFTFGRELVNILDTIVTNYDEDDLKALGQSVVGILDTVRTLTQPAVLEVMGDAGEVLQNSDDVEPVGVFGMVRATRDAEVQRGMAVMLEVLKHVGRGASALDKAQGTPKRNRKARVAAATAPKAGRRGVERPAKTAAPSAPAKTEATRAGGTVQMDGVAFTDDGYLADPQQWTRELGVAIAAAQGIEALSDEQWKVVDFARGDFLEHGMSPNIRRITQQTGLATKDIYRLFPKAPGRTIARIAGIPKPAGCL